MEHKSNLGKALVLLHVLVDETREDAPMTKRQLLRRCEDKGGFYLHPKTFDKYIRDMAQGGIIIRRRVDIGKERNAQLFWYADGWI